MNFDYSDITAVRQEIDRFRREEGREVYNYKRRIAYQEAAQKEGREVRKYFRDPEIENQKRRRRIAVQQRKTLQ